MPKTSVVAVAKMRPETVVTDYARALYETLIHPGVAGEIA